MYPRVIIFMITDEKDTSAIVAEAKIRIRYNFSVAKKKTQMTDDIGVERQL